MTWWHYLLLSNLYLILFYGFYVLLLQRETFFQLNRIYLVGSAVMSFLIPVIQLDWVKQWFITQKVQETIYSASPGVIYIKGVQPDQITVGHVLGSIYIAGILVLSVKLLWQLFTLSRFIRSNKQVATAWSFFKKIKVDEQLQNHEVIVAHEEVHARQWHSADVLLIEVIMILNWFNPVVYLYRRSIKHIHEFIADRDALKAGTNKADYALLLLSQTFDAPVHHLLNPFLGSSVLKKRIIMLQKNKSHYSALLKYGFSAPLFALMLALSSATLNNSSVVKSIHKEAEQMFSIEAPVLADAPLTKPVVIEETRPAEEIKVSKPEFNINTSLVVNDIPTAKAADALSRPDSLPANTSNEVFSAVEKLPTFPGGTANFYKFIGKTVHYPAEALQHSQQGRVNVTFIVQRDGSLSDFKVLKDPGYGLGDEALRILAASPRWEPGEQNGHPVPVQYTVPVIFTLDDEGGKTDTAKRKSFATLQLHKVVNFKRSNSEPATDTLRATGKALNKVMVISYKRPETDATAMPLIILDGKELPAGTSFKTLDVSKIASVSVVKRDDADKAAGQKTDKAIIMIQSKKQ